MNDFIFQSPTRFVFGRGYTDRIGAEVAATGARKALVLYGGGSVERTGTLARVTASLDAAGIAHVEQGGIRPNPEVNQVRAAIETARSENADVILAVGGGSVSDCCKVISAQGKLDEDIWELENTKHTFPTEFIPLGTIVTVFGTGSEMNNGAVITHEEKKIKGAL